MNWNLVFQKLYPIGAAILLILLSFHLPKYFLRLERKNKNRAASNTTKAWAYTRVLGICILFSSFFCYSYPKENLSYFVICFILCAIPAIISIIGFYEQDDKMTLIERLDRSKQMDKEEQEAQKYNSEM